MWVSSLLDRKVLSKQIVMNVQNLYVLQEVLSKLGLADYFRLRMELERSTERQLPAFQLTDVTYYDDCKLEITLYFKRSSDKDAYSFNRYACSLRYFDDSINNREHTFYRDDVIPTIKEAFNLLQGRAVNKDVKSLSTGFNNAWLVLNFYEKDLNGNYKLYYFPTKHGYEIEKIVEMYPIRELQDPDLKATLLLSLKAGDCCAVTLDRSRKSERVYIEANPRLKTIGIYPIKVSH